MKTVAMKKQGLRFLSEGESIERLRINRPDLYKALKNPSPKVVLGANVVAFRSQKGLSQKALSDKSKVGFRTLQRIEEAQPSSNPTMDVVAHIADALEVGFPDLFKPVDLTKTINAQNGKKTLAKEDRVENRGIDPKKEKTAGIVLMRVERSLGNHAGTTLPTPASETGKDVRRTS